MRVRVVCDWVGSERFCRPYFRLAIGSALVASALVVYVVSVFALRLGLALGA
jgi:hypothetical protein